MEKEDSTVKEPVGSSASEDVKKVDAHEEEDHSINTPIKNELSGDEMVGPTNDTREESLENKHEHQDREPSTTKHLSDNELDETTADDQNQKIEASSKRNLVDDSNDMEIRSREENMSTDNTTSSSSVGPSISETSIDAVTGVPDIKKEDQEKDKIVNDTTISSIASDIDIRGQKDDQITNNRLSNSENSVNTLIDVPDIQKEDQEKGNSVNDTTISSTARDIDIRDQKDEHSTNNSLLNSENSINASNGAPDIKEEDQEKDKIVNNATISSTASDIDIRDQKDDHFTNNSLSNSEDSVNAPNGAPDIQKEDQEKGNSVNDTTISSNASDLDIGGQKDDHSTNNSLSNSEKLVNNLTDESHIQKEEKGKGNSVNDTAISSTASDIDIRDHKDDHSPNNSHLKSENSIDSVTGVPDTQKEDQERGNSVNDTKISSTATDIDITGQKDDHSTNNSLSSSENSSNTLTDEPHIHKEDEEKGNSVNDTTLKEGEISDYMKDKEDTDHSSETVKVNNQPTENMEMETNHIQKESKDDEKIGDDMNNQKGITKISSSEETGDKESNPKENTSSKKEERLIVHGTHEPIMEVNSPSVVTKFVKLKSLYSASNVFRRLSKKPNSQIDSDERKSQEVSQTPVGKNNEKKKEVNVESMESIPIKGRVVLYTKLRCQDCKELRLFLRKKRLKYSEINIDVYPGRKQELEKMTGSSDVPKVFFNHVLIGGLNEVKDLDESGKLQEKIEYVTSQGPSPKGPLPPFSGEDDVSSRGIVDELAVIVRKMKESIAVKDRFYKFRRFTNCFLGSEAVDFLSEDQFLEREEAVEFARKLAKELFFRHVLEENTFEDGNHLYRFLDQDPVISQCQNIPRGIIQLKRQPLVELSHRLRFLLYAILEAYISEDGRHVAYRTIHGSEEFARFLRIAEELQRVDLNKTAKEERLAFFINLYNLMAIHAILVWGHPEGALDRRKLFNEFKYVIGGCAYSLSDIYNGILRANQRPPYTLIKPFSIYDKRFKVSLPYPEPLVHFALVSGNGSAPALRCYSPKNIDMELVEAAHDFLQSGAFVLQLDTMTISVTKILKWYSVDFGKNEVEVIKHAANYMEVEKTRTLLELLNSKQLKVVYQPYDWRLNS